MASEMKDRRRSPERYCYFCGKETVMVMQGIPICVACDDLTASERTMVRTNHLKTLADTKILTPTETALS